MEPDDKCADAARSLKAAIEKLAALEDSQKALALDDETVRSLLMSLAPCFAPPEASAYDYLLEHKHGLARLARLRSAIHRNYSIEGVLDGTQVWLSPIPDQWFDDGVLLVQGRKPFEGTMTLYRAGVVSHPIVARDIARNHPIGANDFVFVSPEEARNSVAEGAPADAGHLDKAITELEAFLAQGVNDEATYQEHIQRYPFAFGAQYRKIQRHEKLDDRNIPDFTGIKVTDGTRDVFEIKAPFLQLFKGDGTPSAEFNDAWNQAERYLDFVRREQDYLHRQKGLRFENPHVRLIIGYRLTEDQRKLVRSKERLQPAIAVWTYDDLLGLAKETRTFLNALRSKLVVPERKA